jgi:hypothetical protein
MTSRGAIIARQFEFLREHEQELAQKQQDEAQTQAADQPMPTEPAAAGATSKEHKEP